MDSNKEFINLSGREPSIVKLEDVNANAMSINKKPDVEYLADQA